MRSDFIDEGGRTIENLKSYSYTFDFWSMRRKREH